MPEMNGDEVIAKIRKLYSEYTLLKDYLPYICVISSCIESSDEIQSAMRSGADEYSSKPPEPKFLVNAYKKAIRK